MEASRSIGFFGPSCYADSASRRPVSILLEQLAHIGDLMNEDTVARVESSDGHTMDVSLWIHQPPALSYLCVKYHMVPDSESKDAYFEDEPHVVGAEGRFILIRARFDYGENEFFMYKMGDIESGELASLHPIHIPDDYHLPRLDEFAIVPQNLGSHYLLAGLSLGYNPLYYKLHMYSSEDERWTEIQLLNPYPELNKVISSKVITLGECVIGWVDFRHGMLVCDVKKEDRNLRYIPLPEPLPENRKKLKVLPPGPSTRRYRDLTCINGVIKFIEMEHRSIDKRSDPSDKDLLFDSDCISSRKFNDVDKKLKWVVSRRGWRVVTWSRTVSCICWHKGSIIDVSDLTVNRSGIKCETIVEKIVNSASPILSIDANDMLYLKSVSNYPNGWMIAVDLMMKRVEALGAYCSAMPDPLVKAYCPFVLPTSLNMDSGIEVSACCKIADVGSCAYDPYNTPICAGHPSSCGSYNKRPRLLAEKVNRGQYGAQKVVQNDHISLVSPSQNNLAPEQCFNKCDGVSYHGYSQQLPSFTSFAYGTPSDYANNLRNWELHRRQE